MTEDAAPWTGRAEVRLRGVGVQPRILDLLDLGWQSRVKNPPGGFKDLPKSEKLDALVDNFYADISQQNVREPWGNLKVATTSSVIYSYKHDRILFEEELLRLQGHPIPADITCGKKGNVKSFQELAGEAMTLPVLASAMMSMILKVPLPGLWQRAPSVQPPQDPHSPAQDTQDP
eukprot:9497812-Pyramimonas_sp.AAC.1